jgi:hypothetical protein
MPSAIGGGSSRDVDPGVERAVGLAVEGTPMRPARRRRAASARACANTAWIARVSCTTWSGSRAESRRAAAAASRRRRGTSRRRQRFDHLLGTDRPGDPPAGVAPVLGQAVDDDHRIFVDVLDVARRRHRRRRSGARIDVVRVELVEQQRAVELARRPPPSAASSCPAISLPVGLHGFDSRIADSPRPRISRRKSSAVKAVAAARLEQDGDRRERGLKMSSSSS